MTRFRYAYKKLLPSWLHSDEMDAVLYSLGVTMDAFLERMRLGLFARFPEHAPSDALAYLGRDRKIVRGINEPADAYADRLVSWLDDHRKRGNPYALMGQLRSYCQANVRIRTVDARGNWFTIDRDGSKSALIKQGNWDWDGADASSWSRFWVIIYPEPVGQDVFSAGEPDAGGEIVLPSWLTITCPSLERSAQSSASTVKTGLGANAARAFSLDGSTWELLLEPAGENFATNQDFSTWTNIGGDGVDVTSCTLPDGSTGAVNKLTDDSAVAAEQKRHSFITDNAGVHTLSCWTQLTGATPTNGGRIDYRNPELFINVPSLEANWAFHSDTDSTSSTSGNANITPRFSTVADTGDIQIWAFQLEERGYPTSFMGADGATFTRSADVLRADPNAMAPSGRFDSIKLRYRPHYATGETTVDHNLIYFDASNRLFYRQSDNKLVLRIGGADIESSALTFSRHQELSIDIEHSDTQRRLTVSGATSGNGETTGTASAALSLPSDVYILGGSTGSEEGAGLTYLSSYAPDHYLPWSPSPVWTQSSMWTTPALCIGQSSVLDEAASVRSIVREWQMDGSRCEWIIIAYDDGAFDPADVSPPLPDGSWGKWSKNVGGNIQASRNQTARFWKGVDGTP